MIARDFMTADKAVAVEQLYNGCKPSYIVRWDFETVKNQIPTPEARRARRANALSRTIAEGAAPEPQYTERDSGFVAFSVKVYHLLPTPDEVVADIEADLAARYTETERPDIDLAQYRLAIENIHNLKIAE